MFDLQRERKQVENSTQPIMEALKIMYYSISLNLAMKGAILIMKTG